MIKTRREMYFLLKSYTKDKYSMLLFLVSGILKSIRGGELIVKDGHFGIQGGGPPKFGLTQGSES